MSQDEQLLTVAEVADRAGLSLSRVRYYEREGLLPSPQDTGRRRRYRDGVLERLQIIVASQEAGLTLSEIRELSELRGLVIDGSAGDGR
ncbi:MAG: redox-sensitive transcriptional activator SoxR [Conexibacter sp.]|nr:redox-sensitive transcriptional activator SoxR [Conexibacter sp.]